MENELDKYGRRLGCHFYSNNGSRVSCTALRSFYNEDDNKNQCGSCPFFKTDEEFMEGWNRRYTNDQRKLRSAV